MAERLTAEEHLMLQEAFGNALLLSALRRILRIEELSKLDAMRSEALGHGRAPEVIRLAAESRVYAELEGIIKSRIERMAPQNR